MSYAAVIVGLLGSGLALSSRPARAEFGIVPGSYAASTSSTQAGAHGDLTTRFVLQQHQDPNILGPTPDGDVRNIVVSLPPGVIGNPQAYPQCRSEVLTRESHCPADSQIGIVTYSLAGPQSFLGHIVAPLYNMVPQNGNPAEFAFKNRVLAGVQVHIIPSIRTGSDYGITATVPHLPGNLKLLENEVTLWGIPTDPAHDGLRGTADAGGCLGLHAPTGGLCPSQAQVRPFLNNPTQCGVDATASLTIDSWEAPGAYTTPLLATPQQMSGCDKLVFEPTLTLQPATAEAREPARYTVDLHVPQTDSPTALATPHLRKARVELPVGVVISPSAADGLQACSDQQIGIHDAADPSCPDASKIGAVEVSSPLLPGLLEGAVYQGTQIPGQLIRVFLVAKGFGVLIKLPGSVDLDPDDGRITATFDDNPQLPFDDFTLTFKGGPRAPLANPRACGPATTSSLLTSWAGQAVITSDTFDVSDDGRGAACPPSRFAPSFEAHVVNPIARAHSSFTVAVTREDRDAYLRSISVSLPPGLLARIASVPLCGVAAAAAGTCSEGSRIGDAITGAGPGPQPFFIRNGRVYLTKGSNGHPFGLSIVVPAKAGPIDLGNVVVRASIDVRDDGSIRVLSDPIPRILQGIPLQVRSIRIDVDRERFMVNPSSCDTTAVAGQVSSVEGATAKVSSRFQLTGCDALPFSPKLSIVVGRTGHTTRGRSTPLTATLTQTPGQAAVKRVQVLLPLALNALLPVVEKACTRAAFDAGHCEKARAGSAEAITPLLKHALKGSVYFVKTAKKGALPDLIVALRGQVDINLIGHITIPASGQLGTDFAAVPDVPLKRFTLNLTDGSHGPVGIVDNVCGAKARAQHVAISITGQNGSQVQTSPQLHVRGCTAK